LETKGNAGGRPAVASKAPMRSSPQSLDQRERRPSLYLFLLFLVLAAGIITAGYLFYRSYARNFRGEVKRGLSSIAELKVGQLVQWRKERLADASVFYRNRVFTGLVERLLETPADTDVRGGILSWLDRVRNAYQYDRVFILDAQGIERLAAPGTPEPVASHLLQQIPEILRSNKITFLDFHRDTPDRPIHLGLVVPVREESDGGRPLGVLVLRIDPAVYLYPFIQQWPTPNRTAETLLIRREGDEALFLNEPRFRKNCALSLRVPLNRGDVPAVKAALGQEGIVEANDYRGVPVVADVRGIPDSPWFLVTCIDTTEVIAPLRERLWMIIGLVAVLLFGAGAGVGLIWRQQRLRFFRERLAAAKRIYAVSSRQEALLSAVPDIIMEVDQNKVYTWANPAGIEFFGEDVIGKEAAFYFEGEQDTYETVKPIFYGLEDTIYVESWQRRKDGQKRLLAWWCRVLKDEDGRVTGALSSVRDITDRTQAEEALKESEKRFRDLSSLTSEGIMVHKGGVILDANQAFAELLGCSSPDNLIGKNGLEIIPFTSESRQRILAHMRTGSTETYEIELVKSDGSILPAETCGKEITYRGCQTRLVSMRDITERKRAEETVRMQRDLAAALGATTRLDEALKLCLKAAITAGQTDSGGIYLIDPATGAVDIAYHEGLSSEFVKLVSHYEPDAPYVRLVMEGKFCYVPVKEFDPAMAEPMIREGLRSLAVVPIRHEGQIIACLNVASHILEDIPAKARVPLETIAAQIGSIIARIQTEDALRVSEERYQGLVESVNEAIIVAQDGMLKFTNPKASEITGYSRNDLIMMPFVKLIHPDDRQMVVDRHLKRLAGEELIQTYPFRVIDKGGNIKWVEINAVAISWEGRPATLNCITDITGRKRAEEALSGAEENFRHSLDDSPLGVRIVTTEGETIYANRAILDIYGFSSLEELRTTPVKKRYTPESYAEFQKRYERRQRGEDSPSEYEVSIVRKNGEVRHLLVSRKELFWNGKKQYQTLYRDITERMRAEEKLRESEEKYRAIIETNQEWIWQINNEGIHTYSNPAIEQILGYSIEDIVGKNATIHMHPEDRREIEEILPKWIENKKGWNNLVLRWLHKDGSIRWLESNAVVLLDVNGELIGFQGSDRDITERKRAEEALRASLREKEVLLREVHHRVKNNMQVISSLFNLQAGYTTNEECRGILKEGQTRIRSMSLVHEKLYQSRDLSKIDLAGYIESLAAHLFHVYLVNSAQVRMETEFEDVSVDINSAVPCGLILNELISNALKHAFPEGRTGMIKIGLRRGPAGAVELRVADDGIGLPEGLDFRKAESFGLQIVNLLVDQLEAAIDLDRTKGTAFTMTFRELKYAPRA